MSAILSPESPGRRPRFRKETPGEYSYVLVDEACDHILFTDGTLGTLKEAAESPSEVWRFDTESAAKSERAEQNAAQFRDLRILRKKV